MTGCSAGAWRALGSSVARRLLIADSRIAPRGVRCRPTGALSAPRRWCRCLVHHRKAPAPAGELPGNSGGDDRGTHAPPALELVPALVQAKAFLLGGGACACLGALATSTLLDGGACAQLSPVVPGGLDE